MQWTWWVIAIQLHARSIYRQPRRLAVGSEKLEMRGCLRLVKCRWKTVSKGFDYMMPKPDTSSNERNEVYNLVSHLTPTMSHLPFE